VVGGGHKGVSDTSFSPEVAVQEHVSQLTRATLGLAGGIQGEGLCVWSKQ
jgi:hypothetical protein